MNSKEKYIIPSESIQVNPGASLPSFIAFYDKYSELLFGIAFKMTANYEQSEKILLETFTHISNHLHEYDESKPGIQVKLISVVRKYINTNNINPEIEIHHSTNHVSTLNHSELSTNQLADSLVLTNEQTILDRVFFGGEKISIVALELEKDESEIKILLREAINNYRKIKERL